MGWCRIRVTDLIPVLSKSSGSEDKVSLLESVSRVSRRDVDMNPIIFLLTCYRPKHSFFINLEIDDFSMFGKQSLIVRGDSVQ